MTSTKNYNLNAKNSRLFIIGKTINQNIPMFNDVEKILQERTNNKVYCKCGHSVSLPAAKDKVICSWCGRTVHNKTKSHFKYKLRKMKDGDNMACGKGKKKK